MEYQELERLYDSYSGAIYALALNFLRHEAEARDVLQEVFIKLAREPEIMAGVRQEKSFLLTMAYRMSLDSWRKKTTRKQNEGMFADESVSIFAPSEDPDAEAFRVVLSQALGELPLEQRAVVHLKLWEGWTFEAIGKELNISMNTAASRYRYGIDKLRTLLRPIHGEL